MIENKPIALMTGLPGSGKTALIVKFIKEAAEKGRPIYQTGIAELKIPYIPMPPMDTWTELREDPEMPGVMCPFFTFPENSLIVLSEAQRLYRPRPSGAKVPDHVAAFETCRHTGVTFIFDTQHPDFIDSHCRKLVGQHIHLLDHGVMGRWHYEWPYTGTITSFKEAPIKKKYTLPKEIFGLYKSSSLHIKRKYTIPPLLIVAAVLIVVVFFLVYRMYNRISSRVNPAPEVAVSTQAAGSVPMSSLKLENRTPADLLQEFVPVVPGRPETAPAYDQLRQVKLMPAVVGCYQTSTRCACQNQQGLDAGLDDMQCRQWIKNPPFDPYREASQPVIAQPARSHPVEVVRPPVENVSPLPPASV